MAAGVASDGSTEPGDGASTELFGEETTNQDSLEPEAGELLWLLEDCGVPIWNSGVVAEAVVLDCPATTQALEHKRLQRTHNLNPSYKQAPFKENHLYMAFRARYVLGLKDPLGYSLVGPFALFSQRVSRTDECSRECLAS